MNRPPKLQLVRQVNMVYSFIGNYSFLKLIILFFINTQLKLISLIFIVSLDTIWVDNTICTQYVLHFLIVSSHCAMCCSLSVSLSLSLSPAASLALAIVVLFAECNDGRILSICVVCITSVAFCACWRAQYELVSGASLHLLHWL